MSEFASEPAGEVSADPGVVDEPSSVGGVQVSPEEWEATQERLAQFEQQAVSEEQGWDLFEAQQALAQGDPGALQRLHELNMAGLDERLAPIAAWAEGLQSELAHADAEREADRLIEGHLERLGVEGVSSERVWDAANAYLEEAQSQAATPEERALLGGREAALMALEWAAEDVAREARPLGTGPNAVTNRLFGRDQVPVSSLGRSGSGLGNVPNALTRKWFG